jgi:transcription initiation factor TFIID subunit 1, fungi type
LYEPKEAAGHSPLENDLSTPANKVLESGAWTQSIIWGPNTPFRDFTQLEFNHEDDIIPEERNGWSDSNYTITGIHGDTDLNRPRKRVRTDGGVIRDKFNISNDHYYEVAKDGGRHRVRQTFGQLTVDHAYPAQKLQLPFVSRSFNCYSGDINH